MEKEQDRRCFYKGYWFTVHQGYSGKTGFTLDIKPELHLTTDDIFEVFRAIDSEDCAQLEARLGKW